MAPKPSCCIRFCCCCFSSSSSSDEKRQDPTSAGRRSPPSAIETPSVDSKRTEARKCEIEPVEPNPCNVSGPARQSDKAPASASPNILQKSDQDENVNVNKNVSGDPAYNETPPTASIEASKYDMHAKASTSVPSNAVPASSQSSDVPQKSEGANVNINQNVSGAPSSSSPTQTTKADLLKTIGKRVDVNLDELMADISNLLKLREQEKTPTTSKFHWPAGFKNLKAILSFGTDLNNFTESLERGLEFASKLEKIISGPVKIFLKGIGQASIVTAGLLVVAYALERFDELSTNKDKCWDLIKEMYNLATVVKRWNESSKGTVLDVMEDATALVVEGAIMCCTKISGSDWNRFLLSSDDKADLSGISQKLHLMYLKINANISISVLASIKSQKNPPVSIKFPEHAVGIDKPVKEVLGLLDCKSKQKAVTVILQGLEGMGKTTLADAVCSRLDVEECTISHVQLFEDKDSKPDILSLQKKILKDLMGGQEKAVPDIIKYQDGQTALLRVLTKVYALIYIDNVLEGEALQKLLPSDMSTARKVRLLLTARNQNVMIACPRPCTKPEVYEMKGIQYEAALEILEKEITEGISHDQFNGIIRACGGNPGMLTLIAPFIGRSKNKEENYSELTRKDKWTIEGLKEMIKEMLKRPCPGDALPENVQDPIPKFFCIRAVNKQMNIIFCAILS